MQKHRTKGREAVYAKFGNKCAHCGFADKRALQIDHVHGGGAIEGRKIGSHQDKFYRKVLADTEGRYQLLCANCNWIKRAAGREYGRSEGP
mgnify:FL=1